MVVALAVASLFAVLLADLGLVDFTGSLPLLLHRYYIVAAAVGWLFGNIYVARSRSGRSRLLLLAVYGLGPIPLLFLLRAMAPAQALELAPLVPLFASLMFLVFFVVPVSLRAPARQRLQFERPAAQRRAAEHHEDPAAATRHPSDAASTSVESSDEQPVER